MESIFLWHSYVMDADRIPVIVAAVFLTVIAGMITGPLAGNANPFAWWVADRLFSWLGVKMDKSSRPHADLVFRGFLLCSVMLFLFAFAAGFVPAGFYAQVVVLSLFLTSGSIWFILLRLFFALSEYGNVEGAYYGLSRSSRVDLNSVDDFGIVRCAMGYSATAFDKGLVAPCLWFLIGGLPLVSVCTVLSFFVWRFGRCGHGGGFAFIPLALEKLTGIVPSFFAGFILTAASAVTPTTKMLNAVQVWWKAKDTVPYEQGGIALNAMAWPLDVNLGGPCKDVDGYSLANAWAGAKDSSARINRHHLKRAIYMHVVSLLLFIFILLSAYICAGKLL